jgi:hypothetical protein
MPVSRKPYAIIGIALAGIVLLAFLVKGPGAKHDEVPLETFRDERYGYEVRHRWPLKTRMEHGVIFSATMDDPWAASVMAYPTEETNVAGWAYKSSDRIGHVTTEDVLGTQKGTSCDFTIVSPTVAIDLDSLDRQVMAKQVAAICLRGGYAYVLRSNRSYPLEGQIPAIDPDLGVLMRGLTFLEEIAPEHP